MTPADKPRLLKEPVPTQSRMRFGVALSANPPWKGVVQLAKRAELLGFDDIWLSDSGVTRMSSWPLFALIATETTAIRIGVCVTNPGIRDPADTAVMLATLNAISAGRMVCGLGRGDSSLRSIGLKPVSVDAMEQAARVIKQLVEGMEVSYNGVRVRIPWTTGHPVEILGAGYGPKAIAAAARGCDGYILQLADGEVLTWALARLRAASARRERFGDFKVNVLAPVSLSRDWEQVRSEIGWFAALVARHTTGLASEAFPLRAPVPGALGGARSDETWSAFIKRVAVVGPVDDHVKRISDLQDRGVTQFNLLLEHKGAEDAMDAYGADVIPRFRSRQIKATEGHRWPT